MPPSAELVDSDDPLLQAVAPLAKTDRKADVERLFTVIVSITPAPLGLGPALQ